MGPAVGRAGAEALGQGSPGDGGGQWLETQEDGGRAGEETGRVRGRCWIRYPRPSEK